MVGPILTFDRGNSTLDCRLQEDGVVERQRFDVALPERALRSALDSFLGPRRHALAAALTVVDGGLDVVESALAARGLQLQIAGRELACPLGLAYADPTTLGTDRWVGAYAAWRRLGACVVVDCGTALTVNLVTVDGRFLGGAIAPGIGAMVFGLGAKVPRLPIADLDRAAPALPAAATQDAVQAGILLGFCGLVERLVGDLAEAAGLQDAPIVLTGGRADVYQRHGRLPVLRIPDLVHEGLACLLNVPSGGC